MTEASEQARRKAAFVTSNLKDSMEQLGIKIKDASANIEVHPLIITSSPLFAGWSWNEIAVSDWLIIYHFFVDGKLELLGYHNEDGELVHTMSETFYKSSDEAERAVIGYFAQWQRHAARCGGLEQSAGAHQAGRRRLAQAAQGRDH
jgi:hypothetical protein